MRQAGALDDAYLRAATVENAALAFAAVVEDRDPDATVLRTAAGLATAPMYDALVADYRARLLDISCIGGNTHRIAEAREFALRLALSRAYQAGMHHREVLHG